MTSGASWSNSKKTTATNRTFQEQRQGPNSREIVFCRRLKVAAVYREYEDSELTRFLKRDYKKALLELEVEGKVTIEPRKHGLADDKFVTFPKGR